MKPIQELDGRNRVLLSLPSGYRMAVSFATSRVDPQIQVHHPGLNTHVDRKTLSLKDNLFIILKVDNLIRELLEPVLVPGGQKLGGEEGQS